MGVTHRALHSTKDIVGKLSIGLFFDFWHKQSANDSGAVTELLIVRQDTSAAAAGYAPDANSLDAFWERTEALLAREAPEDDMAADEEASEAVQSSEAQALAAAKVQAISAAGRLVAFQVRTRPSEQAKKA